MAVARSSWLCASISYLFYFFPTVQVKKCQLMLSSALHKMCPGQTAPSAPRIQPPQPRSNLQPKTFWESYVWNTTDYTFWWKKPHQNTVLFQTKTLIMAIFGLTKFSHCKDLIWLQISNFLKSQVFPFRWEFFTKGRFWVWCFCYISF